jgi:hypothetical protein
LCTIDRFCRGPYFNPVKALEAALSKAKTAAAQGEEIDLRAIISAAVQKPKRRAPNFKKEQQRAKSKDKNVDSPVTANLE